MTDPQTATAAARAAAVAARMVKTSASPYVMVKHGRREDRAASYDRFIAACAASFYDGEMDRDGVTELLAALQAVELRAPKHVRYAANDLFDRIAGPFGFTRAEFGGWGGTSKFLRAPRGNDNFAEDDDNDPSTSLPAKRVPWWRRVFQRQVETPGVWPGPIQNGDALLLALDDFTQVARLDVLERGWHALLTPRVKRWWLGRK